MTRYKPSRQYLRASLGALGLGLFCGWWAVQWPLAVIPAGLFLASAVFLVFLASRPVIIVHEQRLQVGKRVIPWSSIRRVDRTGWVSPLVLNLTLADESRFLLIYPGDLDSSTSLLRQLRLLARESLIDGVPYREFWGETTPKAQPPQEKRASRYPLLRPEDEAEVERLYQRLKTVGRLDPKSGSEEK